MAQLKQQMLLAEAQNQQIPQNTDDTVSQQNPQMMNAVAGMQQQLIGGGEQGQDIQDENVLPQELLSTEQDRKNNQFNVSTLLNMFSKIPSMLKNSLFSNKENK